MLYFLLLSNFMFVLSLSLGLFKGEPLIGDWVMVPYHLSYSYGFVKRGLLGSVLSVLHLSPSATTVFFLYVLAFESFLILFYIFLHREEKGNPLLPYLMALFVLSPATVFHMGDDVGRTDIYLYILLLLSLRYPRLSPLLTVLALLIHEGYVLMGLPVLLLGIWIKGMRRTVFTNGIVGIVGALIVSVVGRLNADGLNAYSRILASRGITTTEPLLPLLLSPIQNSLHFYTKFLADPTTRITITLGIASTLLLVFLYFLLMYRVSRGPTYLKVVPLSPLLMFPFGIDYFRWASASSIGMALAFVLLSKKFGVKEPDKLDRVFFLLLLLALPLEIAKEVLT